MTLQTLDVNLVSVTGISVLNCKSMTRLKHLVLRPQRGVFYQRPTAEDYGKLVERQ
jgi:hypothetical protein